MKTRLIIEIETPYHIEVYPEEGQTKEDFKGKEEELKQIQLDYSKDLHSKVITHIKHYFEKDYFEEELIDDMDDMTIEGYESFEDYEIKINVIENITIKK